MRNTVFAVIFLTAVVGCAREASVPISPPLAGLSQTTLAQAQQPDGPYRLYGEWTFFINAAHDKVEVVPRRQGRFHLNALKFLESNCTDCLKITGIKNNGDGTIDLTVRITHPFKGYPQYTGFDVKGIIMFNGSYEYHYDGGELPLPTPTFRISWRQMGDPEVLNPDGYTPRWRPNWDWGSDMPMFSYWKGKYANGEPSADLNAFLNFYTHEERHMFLVDGSVERTYKIWLPPGKPVTAAYAVEACWEPPLVTPVTDPVSDFPSSANQPEAYRFVIVANNGEVITDCEECCGYYDCSDFFVEVEQWGGFKSNRMRLPWPDDGGSGYSLMECDPPQENRYGWSPVGFVSCHLGNGTHRLFASNFHYDWPPKLEWFAFTVFDVTINDPG
jgi:hypothetical protein